MKLVEASFEQIFFTGVQFLNQRLSGKVLLEDGETLEDGWNKLKKDADDFHKKNYPHLYETYGHTSAIQGDKVHVGLRPLSVQPIPDQTRQHKSPISYFIEDMNKVTEIDAVNGLGVQVGLLAFKGLAESNPELQAAYDQRLKDLS